MKQKKASMYLGLFLIGVIILVPAVLIFMSFNTTLGQDNTEKVKEKIKKELYKEYGKRFVVDRIGLRSANGDKFYQARIYPKSIIGTQKEGDEYYYGKASVGKELFDLGGVADTYGEIKRSLELENMLLPKAKELFGKRVRLKVEQRYEKKNENGYFVSYLNPSLEEVFRRMKKEPDQHRIKLDLDVYVFNRIKDEKEKKKRRKDIFRFVQYLKEEGLFEYLEMRIVFVDERVLAPSYEKFEKKVMLSDKVEKKIEEENETVMMPPIELRKRMSKVLQSEIEEMSEERLLKNMRKITKDDLSYDGIGKWNSQYRALVYSEGMVKERYPSSYDEDAEVVRDYEDIDDVKIGTYLNYIYVN